MALSPFTITLRGHNTTDDPTAGGYVEHVISVSACQPKRKLVGKEREYSGAVVRAPRARRLFFAVKPMPVEREGQALGSQLQDYGVYLKTLEILAMKYPYLYASTEGAGTNLRAGSHLSSVTGVGTSVWSSILPIAVELDGDIDPADAGDGTDDWPFTLKARGGVS